jgi:long-chain acyl-CoA synthetase
VLNEPEVEEYLKSKNIYFDKNTNLYEMPEVFNLIDEQIAINNRSLDRYEQVKNFHILDHELTIDSGELTPTLKVKRNVIRARYPHIIKPLFNKPKPETELEETTSQ